MLCTGISVSRSCREISLWFFSLQLTKTDRFPFFLTFFFLSCLVFSCVCFHKMMIFYKAICSALIRRTSAEFLFLTDWRQMRFKNAIDISLVNWWNVPLLKKLHIIYQYGYISSHAVFWKNLTCWIGAITSHHLKTQSFGFEKDLNIGMLTVRESLLSNH